MQAKKKLLAGLAVLLVLLAAAFVFLSQEEKKRKEETESPEGTTVILCEQEPSEISEIKIQNASGAVEIANQNGKWKLQGFDEYAQSQEQMERLPRLLTGLTGTLVQEGEFDRERYGFSEGGTTVEIRGREDVKLYLGDFNEGASGWYLMREQDEALYTVSAEAGRLLEASPYSYLDTLFIGAYSKEEEVTERLTKVQIERPDLEEPLIIEVSEDEPQAYMSPYEITSPVHVKTSLKAMNEEIGALFGFAADQALGVYDPTQKAAYGFEEPAMVMTVEHDGVPDVFTVGAAENGSRYLLWSGSDLLYTIEEKKLTLLDADVNSLFFAIALLPKIETVERVELTLNEERRVFELERDAAGEITGVTAQGQGIDEKLFRKFYAFLLEIDVQEVCTGEMTGEPLMSVTYHYLDGGKDTIEAIALEDGRTAGILINDEMSFMGRIAYIEKLKTELGHLLAGEAIDTNW